MGFLELLGNQLVNIPRRIIQLVLHGFAENFLIG